MAINNELPKVTQSVDPRTIERVIKEDDLTTKEAARLVEKLALTDILSNSPFKKP
jgi:hypothetical protein